MISAKFQTQLSKVAATGGQFSLTQTIPTIKTASSILLLV